MCDIKLLISRKRSRFVLVLPDTKGVILEQAAHIMRVIHRDPSRRHPNAAFSIKVKNLVWMTRSRMTRCRDAYMAATRRISAEHTQLQPDAYGTRSFKINGDY